MTFGGTISELDVAAITFCRRGAESRSEGKKRRRLEDEVGDNYGLESMRTLQPVCIGGGW